ncbi:hypothetical protein GEO20_16425 [Rhodococcus erythropolis]|uniref:hypothetical protein n=1 Tax=Rhodococcus erythropolis TaxID=1833 RepID=UPI0012918DDA|nr:hypothetical protein [Rhodococcus erythropolis]MQP33545.1 hypothetical protein [Rhodococcus erythropolis]
MKNGVPQSMAGLAADLKVDCLRVGDPQNKLATHEIWMATNTHYNHNYMTWVETGYTVGRIDTMNAGLIWGDNHFWADQRDPNNGNNYHEWYIRDFATGVWVDHGITWVPNSNNWTIWNNHQVVGTSIDAGAYAGGGQIGMESSTSNVRAFGQGANFRYNPGNGAWVAPPYLTAGDPGQNVLFTSKNSTSSINSWSAQGCNVPLAAGAPTVGGADIAPTQFQEAVEANRAKPRLTADNSSAVVDDVANAFEMKDRGTARVTETSRSRYAASENAVIDDDRQVIVVQIDGDGTVPRSMTQVDAVPRGNVTVTIDPETRQVLDMAVTGETKNLSAMGRTVEIG